MRNTKVNKRLLELRQLIKHAGDVTDDISLQEHWARYLCVVTAGFLEYSIQAIYFDFAKSSSSRQFANFVENQLRRIGNPNTDRFLQTAGAFNPEWRKELELFFQEGKDGEKEAINSMISMRNNIAHGGSADITTERVRDYLERSVKVLEFIERQCEKALRQK